MIMLFTIHHWFDHASVPIDPIRVVGNVYLGSTSGAGNDIETSSTSSSPIL